MKTIQKSKNICLLALIISVLLFTGCDNKTTGKISTPEVKNSTLSYYDHFDSIMLSKVQTETELVLKKEGIDKPEFTSPVIEERYIAELCHCYAESESVLKLMLKTNKEDCSGSPVGYQRFRLTRFKTETTKGKALSFYTFAAIEKDNKRDERMQNFYISETNNSAEMPDPIHFIKRYNFDYPRWVRVFKRVREKNVSYEFKMDRKPSENAVCFTKIISRQFNMVGGNKPLVFDIMKSFDSKGILLVRQDTVGIRLVQK